MKPSTETPEDGLRLPAAPARPRGARFWLACSGGVDSTVLLDLLAASLLRPLTAVHVHHGLQAAADDWARQCRAQCRRLRVPFRLLRVRIDAADPAGPEAAARAARYAAIGRLMRPGDVLVTAHHRDDQAETVLLRALRGTGIRGLGAMRGVAPFGPGLLWRPLLELPRERIAQQAARRGLEFVDDPQNSDPRYARSFLRSAVMPGLRRHWPQAAASLARLALHAQEADLLLDALGLQDLAAATQEGTPGVAALLALAPGRRRNALRCWLAQAGLPAPAAALLAQIEQDVLCAGADAAPRLQLGALELRRYRDRLFLMPELPAPPKLRLAWTGRRRLLLPAGCGELRLAGTRAPLPLTVAFATGGERLKPACGGPTRTLKNLFQEAGIAPWLRQRAPLIYEHDSLRCVADYWSDHDWAARGLALRWQVALPGRAQKNQE